MTTSAVSPSESDLKAVLVELRSQNPTLGIPKLHALLISNNPTWTVSEKRTRKILQAEGLILAPPATTKPGDGSALFPSSSLIEGFDVAKYTTKVEVKYFGKAKGKGLVAKERIAEGEVIWKEDPFILAPEWDLYDLQTKSLACAFCSTPLRGAQLSTSCPASTSATPCAARFCSRLCLSRSARTHPLLCAAQNPASVPLLTFARRSQWMALHALAQCTARILLTKQVDEVAVREDWKVVRALAELGMEERVKGIYAHGAEPDRATWKNAYKLYMQAFKEPTTEGEKKKLNRLLKKPLDADIANELFDYDAFLRGLGRMSLNLESHGGLYTLHSHINHSCAPNVSARHLDQRTALSRITVIAKRDIEPGEELFITYVDPEESLEQRRQRLIEWGFGLCKCERCVAEENDPNRKKGAVAADGGDLERELKAGLGVM